MMPRPVGMTSVLPRHCRDELHVGFFLALTVWAMRWLPQEDAAPEAE